MPEIYNIKDVITPIYEEIGRFIFLAILECSFLYVKFMTEVPYDCLLTFLSYCTYSNNSICSCDSNYVFNRFN